MSEQAEIYSAMREQAQEKKRRNLESSTKILQTRGLIFTSNNNGVHLQIGTPVIADFWPSTGKYIFRDPKLEGRGVFNLLKLLEGQITQAIITKRNIKLWQ